MKSSNSLRQFLLENNFTRVPEPEPIQERVVKVGNNVYWRTGDKYFTKGGDGVKREISSSEYDKALQSKRVAMSKAVDDAHDTRMKAWNDPEFDKKMSGAGITTSDLLDREYKAFKDKVMFGDRDEDEHRDRQTRLGFSRNGWVSKEAMDLAETPASQIKNMKNVRKIVNTTGSEVTPESLKGLSGIGKPDAFKAIADAANRGEEIGSAQVNGQNILYYGDHVIVR